MNARLHPFAAAARRAELLDAADALLVTRLCERAGPAGSDAEAALAAVVCALCRACADGSLCVPADEEGLGGILRELLSAGEFPADDAGAFAGGFVAAADAGLLEAVLGTPAVPRPLIRAHGNLYFHRHWFAERTVATELAARRGAGDVAGGADEATRRAVLHATLAADPLRAPDGGVLELTDRQRLALETALRERVFVLSGGPGTGKTTWTAAWLRAVLRLPGVTADRVRLCAPTGRAARRLEESLRERLAGADPSGPDGAARAIGVTTLHAALGYRAFEGLFARGPGDPLDADWVLLDEASMADVFLLAALVRALPPGARLVLAGDPDQLPAVGAGAVLADLLPEGAQGSGPVPSVTLDAGHRARGAVIALAEAVRAGDDEAVLATLGPPRPAADFFAGAAAGPSVARVLPEPGGDAGLGALLDAHAGAAFGAPGDGGPAYAALLERFRRSPRDEEPVLLAELWRRAARARVLAPLRRGPVSAERANRLLRGRLEPAWRRPGDARGTGFHGAPVLITRNDDRAGLSNGDTGIWLEAGDGAAVFFPRIDHPDGWLRVPVALLPPHELGFASTVHKSQGSEYDAVLLLLPEPGNRLLARETFYTAITRARDAVFVFGAEEAVREATTRTLRRRGGLRAAFAELPPRP